MHFLTLGVVEVKGARLLASCLGYLGSKRKKRERWRAQEKKNMEKRRGSRRKRMKMTMEVVGFTTRFHYSWRFEGKCSSIQLLLAILMTPKHAITS